MAKDEDVTRQLLATGWFAELDGPEGLAPVQAFGRLASGEELYFRARGTTATLEITHDTGRTTLFVAEVGSWPAASFLTPEQCATLIVKWLGGHFKATDR